MDRSLVARDVMEASSRCMVKGRDRSFEVRVGGRGASEDAEDFFRVGSFRAPEHVPVNHGLLKC